MSAGSGPAVLQVLVSTRPGGGPRHVLDLCLGLRARGWRAVVAGPRDGAYFDRFAGGGLETAEAPTDRLHPGAVLALLRLARRHRIQLIHSHGKGAGLHARLAARALGIPAIHTFHGIHVERYGRLGRAAYLGLERWLARGTAAVVHVSHAQEAEARLLGLAPAGRSHVVVNGIDIERVQRQAIARDEARRRLALDLQAAVVGSVARLDEVKRLDALVRAVARTARPGLVLVLVGAGPDEPRLRRLVRDLGAADRVQFAGEIPDAARLLRAFDICAAPSRREGMPLAVVEAMALALPVVASDIPAHREVLGAGSAGLVAAGVEDLGAALERLLDDATQRSALGAENRARAEKEFGAARMVDEIETLYRRVLAAGG